MQRLRAPPRILGHVSCNYTLARWAMKILIVDDEAAICRVLAAKLREHEVVCETDPIQALARIHGDEQFDVVVSDYTMRGMDGVQLLVAAKARCVPPIVILMSGFEDVFSAAQVADAVLIKPFTTRELLATIDDALQARTRRPTKRMPRMIVAA